MQDFVRQFISQYPKATLQDIYKGAFQDKFGPAHILTDRTAVERYINQELKDMDNEKRANRKKYYEPCSWRGNFYRVDLSVIKDGKVPMDNFVDAFMQSAQGIDTNLTAAWVEEWNEMQKVVHEVAPDIERFSADSLAIASLLSEGKYVVHHSRQFDEAYHPHYRIIRRDLFEIMILPYLNQR